MTTSAPRVLRDFVRFRSIRRITIPVCLGVYMQVLINLFNVQTAPS